MKEVTWNTTAGQKIKMELIGGEVVVTLPPNAPEKSVSVANTVPTKIRHGGSLIDVVVTTSKKIKYVALPSSKNDKDKVLSFLESTRSIAKEAGWEKLEKKIPGCRELTLAQEALARALDADSQRMDEMMNTSIAHSGDVNTADLEKGLTALKEKFPVAVAWMKYKAQGSTGSSSDFALRNRRAQKALEEGQTLEAAAAIAERGVEWV